jgi:hypothetical protein
MIKRVVPTSGLGSLQLISTEITACATHFLISLGIFIPEDG